MTDLILLSVKNFKRLLKTNCTHEIEFSDLVETENEIRGIASVISRPAAADSEFSNLVLIYNEGFTVKNPGDDNCSVTVDREHLHGLWRLETTGGAAVTVVDEQLQQINSFDFSLPAAFTNINYEKLWTCDPTSLVWQALGELDGRSKSLAWDFLDHDWRDSSCFSDVIYTISGDSVDTSWHTLNAWIAECEDAKDFLENAVSDGFVSFENYDFYRHVQAAQELWIRDNLTKNLENIKRALAYYSLYTRFPVLRTQEVDRINLLDFCEFETYGELMDAVEGCLDIEHGRA